MWDTDTFSTAQNENKQKKFEGSANFFIFFFFCCVLVCCATTLATPAQRDVILKKKKSILPTETLESAMHLWANHLMPSKKRYACVLSACPWSTYHDCIHSAAKCLSSFLSQPGRFAVLPDSSPTATLRAQVDIVIDVQPQDAAYHTHLPSKLHSHFLGALCVMK